MDGPCLSVYDRYMNRYTLVKKKLTVATATATAVEIPEGATELLLRMSSSVAWTWDLTSGLASSGMPMAAGEGLAMAAPGVRIGKTTIYVYQTSGGDATMHVSFLAPKVR